MLKTALLASAIICGMAAPAFAGTDPLAALQAFTLNDIKAAEAVYASNPSVPTYAAATQCLGYLDATLSQAGSGASVGSLTVPKGIASGIADLDVALNSGAKGLNPAVVDFNANCGGYIEDLKAEAAAITAAGGISIFGIHF